ncbi:Tim44 domain-containing protein [Herbaspirillum sp. AP02]|uniref:Tim44 domain-containing protein n=1 Tax=unclassified Herbaspirillum TaxID=2624150 RepID=UPI0015DB5449|nr:MULTISPECIES: Tim44-like domain-containing protein [unclassified Herbaspirillum]MBG7619181.1 Tim44 domain-containing protein [Herbaspirillum sp. AP02]NZD66465.1 Tim44 domain-containing protein [Herbaspirillum sp. AP21]
MKKAFVALIVAVMTLSVGISTVEAKRLGGGGSIGKQSSGASRQAQSPAPMQQNQAAAAKPAAPAAAPAAAAAKPSMWKGLLGGALLGLGLGALLSHLGLGGALASMISTILTVALIALAIMFVIRMFRRKQEASQPTPAWAGAAQQASDNASATPQIGSMLKTGEAPAAAPQGGFGGGFGNTEAVPAYGVPAGFDTVGFVRNAKTYFIRLQAAWDKADINDIREFTTPEMFAELRLQIQERGAASNQTDVVSLDAEVLGVETVGNDYLASVKFFGFIKEDPTASPVQFAEIWNLSKPAAGQGGWVLAGIQQLDPVSA